jgi:RHS repeat-associated protein
MVALNKTYRETLTPDRSAKDSGHRFYSPEISRWLSRDPLGDEAFFEEYANGKDDEEHGRLRNKAHGNTFSFVDNNPVSSIDLHGLISVVDEIQAGALARNGIGPWSYSAAHCWAACRYSLISPFAGQLSALVADIGEAFEPSSDAWRDVAAQHFGANCGMALLPLGALSPCRACDCCCGTW